MIAVIARLLERAPAHALAGAFCLGLAGANAGRVGGVVPLAAAAALAVGAAATADRPLRLALYAGALAIVGVWWGSVRLVTLDRSELRTEVGRAQRTLLEVTGPARRGAFELRIPARVLRFGFRRVREPVLLELPRGRAPPQGSRLELVGTIELPRVTSTGFDEATHLRRQGIHVVVHADRWRIAGRRGGIGAVADRLRERLSGALASGTTGDHRRLLLGIVLGDDGGLPESLRERFRASGLYHLLAVSGQNVALLAGGVLLLAWALGIQRVLAELGALAAIAAYVLAVGAQPSVVRAGVAGALGSLAWLAARDRDRWYFMLVGAIVLLAWNPYDLLDPGFQLSFAAVAAIFLLVPRVLRFLEGYPMPNWLRIVGAVSTACGLATAPIVCLHFGAVPLYTVPANLAAEPAMPPLLGLSFAAVALHPLTPHAAAALASLAGWLAAYIAACARLFGSLPLALLPGRWALVLLAAAGAAYAWRRWRAS